MNDTCKLLVVDDDEGFREMLSRQLSHLGYPCETADGGKTALKALKAEDFDVAFIDLCMPNMDGIALLAEMEKENIGTVPVVISGRGSLADAVDAMKHGAFDYIEKEPDIDILRNSVERAVTHRRVARQVEQVSETARQWEATFDAVPDLVAIIDTEHRLVRVNKSMAARLGRTPQEAIGRPCYEFCSKLGQPIENCPHSKLLEDGQEHILNVTELRLGGNYLVSTSPLYDAKGELMGSVHVARDITETKQAQEKLHEAHAEIERLVSSMSSFLIEVDTEFRIRRWNQAAENTFGVSASDALGQPLVDSGIQWDWSAISGDLLGWLTAAKPVQLPEMRYVRADGVDGILGITANPINDDAGKPTGFFLLGSDITERRVLEAQLVQAQKLESIGQLAAGIAHEINTPTQYVGDNIEFMQCAFEQLENLRAAYDEVLEAAKKGTLEDDMVSKVTAVIEETNVEYLSEQIPRAITQSLEGVGRITSIVGAMKEFSHPGTEGKTCIDLNQAIESTITVSRNEWKYVADIKTDFDVELPPVPCLPGEFNQVILNIIVNAAHAIADATEEGSTDKGTISISTHQEDNWAEIRISDTGTGIPEKARARIFDPFYTTKEVGRGTGQGLAIARNVIVEKHGGTLTFETEMGKGTTFVIRIPLSKEHGHD